LDSAVDRENKSQTENKPPVDQVTGAQTSQADQSVDEFFTRLQSDMRRPDLSQEAISAAFQAIQRLALDSDTEEAVNVAAAKPEGEGGGLCPACNAPNGEESRFCAACGVPLQAASEESAADASPNLKHAVRPSGEHHYHHHYHHHYFPASNGAPQGAAPDFRAAGQAAPGRDAARGRVPLGGASLSRAEAAVRKMTQDWAQACNTKHLDDLVELYAGDALVLRPNSPAVRGSAAIREFFFAALDAGLGEAELEPLRVELFGDIAYEAGRCKTLVPVAVGKRREERGKYLMIFARQPAGDWKTLADCWSSDLSLAVSESTANPSAQNPGSALPRSLR
jgi:ketosteroid isomerase-like protein